MGDLEARNQAFDVRLAAAGGTDRLMNGIVKSVQCTQRILVFALCGLVLDMLLSIGLTVALVELHGTDQKTTRNTRVVAENTKRICQASNKASRAQNALVDALLAALANGTGLPPAEREARATRYAAARVDIIKC